MKYYNIVKEQEKSNTNFDAVAVVDFDRVCWVHMLKAQKNQVKVNLYMKIK